VKAQDEIASSETGAGFRPRLAMHVTKRSSSNQQQGIKWRKKSRNYQQLG
jgi:hypothetical protein